MGKFLCSVRLYYFCPTKATTTWAQWHIRTEAALDALHSVSVPRIPLQMTVTLTPFAQLIGLRVFTSSHLWCYGDSPRMNTGMKADLIFFSSVLMPDEVIILSKRSGQATHKHTLTHTFPLQCKHTLHAHKPKKKSLPTALQEWKERRGEDFPLTSVPANHNAGDLSSVPI